MSTEVMQQITWTLATIVGISAVCGLVVKRLLIPYLKENLVAPVTETRDQVSNDHDSNLRDDIDEMRAAVDRLSDHMMSHLTWSADWSLQIERDLAKKADR